MQTGGARVWRRSRAGHLSRGEAPRPVLEVCPEKVTRRAIFSVCGQLTSNLPMGGWLKVVASYMKRQANAALNSWNDKFNDPKLRAMLAETLKRVEESDPARGQSDVEGDAATV